MIPSEFLLVLPTCWDELPAELLLMIIDNLHDRTSKLRCRLVNSKWRAAANSSLERQMLSSWKRGTHADGKESETPFPLMLIMNSSDTRGIITSNFLVCPLDFAKTSGNPFPNKSLYVSVSPQNRWGYRKSNRKGRVKMLKVLVMFGSHLTSFHLYGVKVTGPQLNLILKHLENLRALTLSSIRILEDNSSDRILVASPPRDLKYLRLYNVNDSNFIQSFVDLCAYQLVSLEVDGFNLRPLRQPKINFNGISDKSPKLNKFQTAWKNLSRLRISSVDIEFLQQTISAPIKHLSIGALSFDEKIKFSDLLKFLEKFSTTLITLYVEVNLNFNVIIDQKFVRNPINFPCLKTLHISYPTNNNSSILLAYENNFLAKCPKLEVIHWLYQSHRSYGGVHELKKQFNFVFHCNLWQICSKLRNMLVSGNKLGYYQPFEVKYSREMFYVWEFEQVLAKLNTSKKISSIIIHEDTVKSITLMNRSED